MARGHGQRGTRTVEHAATDNTSFPRALTEWIDTDAGLLKALVALRRLGEEGADAVSRVLAIRRVARLRASWELWEALTEGDGDDPEVLLLQVVAPSDLEMARRALWDARWDDVLAVPAGRQVPLGQQLRSVPSPR